MALPSADVAEHDRKINADYLKLHLKRRSDYPDVRTHSPGVEDHGQRDGGDPFSGGHAGGAGDGGAFGFQLHSEGFGNAAQEHVEDAELVPVALFR